MNARELVHRIKTLALGRVRDPLHQVILTPSAIGVGNFLYIWMQVMIKRNAGLRASATQTEPMNQWLVQLPLIRSLLIDNARIPFTASRLHGYYQEINRDYTPADLTNFCKTYLLGGSPFQILVEQHKPDDGTIVINVRRGDYYSVPKFRGNYSFDVVGYVRAAVDSAREREPVSHFVVVSDDVAWCRLKLPWLRDEGSVDWLDGTGGPVADLAHLAGARRLILANSTFSYWGGYLAQARNPQADIIAPWFHARHLGGGRLFHAPPSWRLIEEIPGGWDA